MKNKIVLAITLFISFFLLVTGLWYTRTHLDTTIEKLITKKLNLKKYEDILKKATKFQYNIENITFETDEEFYNSYTEEFTFLYINEEDTVAIMIDAYDKKLLDLTLEEFADDIFSDYQLDTERLSYEKDNNGNIIAEFINEDYYYYDVMFDTDYDIFRITFASEIDLKDNYKNKFKEWTQNIRIIKD